MLDANTLSQLASLKTEIGGDKPLLTGVVQGSAGRFGFVVTDDNERHFLPPDEMKRVLPGDRIEFSVTDVEGKSQAAVESLVHSE
ncbi:MAG: exoribonuclease R, partial [Natronospirillum sp.]